MPPRRTFIHQGTRVEKILAANRESHKVKKCTRPKHCGTPECGELAGHGLFGNFCDAHAERLAAIREDFDARSKDKGYHRRRDVSGRTQGGTCCNTDCSNPREMGSRWCESCQFEEDV